MTHTWQRRTAAITGLLALLAVSLLMVIGSSHELGRSFPDVAISSATDHSAFISLPETRPTFAFVETLALLGLGLVVVAGPFDHRRIGAFLVGADGTVRQRRWRARLIGAPPLPS